MDLYYNPLDRACKSIVGAIPRKTVVKLNVYKEKDVGGEDYFSAEVCNLVLRRDGKRCHYYQMTRTDFGWTISLRFNENGLYFYHFAIGGSYIGCGSMHKSIPFGSNPVSWQLTVYDEHYTTPDWFKGGIMYQIFPDRFYRNGDETIKHGVMRNWGEQPYFRPNGEGKVLNNDFFGGNLKGVREKLGYLKSLGVTVIYFNPIFEAFSNHRYDTGDYLAIDPNLGAKEDLDALIADAKKLGMRVILDGVFNHTGDDSRYFNRYSNYPSLGAYQPSRPITIGTPSTVPAIIMTVGGGSTPCLRSARVPKVTRHSCFRRMASSSIGCATGSADIVSMWQTSCPDSSLKS